MEIKSNLEMETERSVEEVKSNGDFDFGVNPSSENESN
jgi:hypothetical protein